MANSADINHDLQLAFKSGMARLAGGVTLITGAGPNKARVGLTVSSAVSLSAAPPSLLCCVNKNSRSHDVIVEAGAFAANVVGAVDQQIAAAFASDGLMEDKFAVGSWALGKTGSPILQTALVSFDCRVREVVVASTHSILIGDVVDVHLAGVPTDGLVYFERQFIAVGRSA